VTPQLSQSGDCFIAGMASGGSRPWRGLRARVSAMCQPKSSALPERLGCDSNLATRNHARKARRVGAKLTGGRSAVVRSGSKGMRHRCKGKLSNEQAIGSGLGSRLRSRDRTPGDRLARFPRIPRALRDFAILVHAVQLRSVQILSATESLRSQEPECLSNVDRKSAPRRVGMPSMRGKAEAQLHSTGSGHH
jgi:hypothetical protein